MNKTIVRLNLSTNFNLGLNKKKIICKKLILFVLVINFFLKNCKKSSFFFKKNKKNIYNFNKAPYRYKMARNQLYFNRKNVILKLIFEDFKKNNFFFKKKKLNNFFFLKIKFLLNFFIKLENNILNIKNIKISENFLI